MSVQTFTKSDSIPIPPRLTDCTCPVAEEKRTVWDKIAKIDDHITSAEVTLKKVDELLSPTAPSYWAVIRADKAPDKNSIYWRMIAQDRGLYLFIDTLLLATRTSEREAAVKEKEELASALISMYEQYCQNGHLFMSAGEEASTVLEQQGYADFDEAGRLTSLNQESHEYRK